MVEVFVWCIVRCRAPNGCKPAWIWNKNIERPAMVGLLGVGWMTGPVWVWDGGKSWIGLGE
jgi:hypothetical protein